MSAAVVDANVLYSAMLRDLVMRLTVGFVFQPKWTARTPDEYLAQLVESGLNQTAARLQVYNEQM